MKVLFATNPGFGHFNPLVPLGRALAGRGHDVRFASEPSHGAAAAKRGFDHLSVGRDLTLDDVLGVLPDIFTVPPDEQDAYARPRVFVGLRAANVIRDLLEVTKSWGPDVIVRETAEFASWAVAERLGVPQVAVNVGAPRSADDWNVDARQWFLDLGEMIGLRDLNSSSLYRHCLLSFEPAGYNDWSLTPTAHVFRTEAVAVDGDVPDEIAALDERPLTYVTLGTEFYNADLMATILSAIRSENLNVVATTGEADDPAALGPQPANVVVEQYIPQDLLLPRCSLVVCHGGAGTVKASLAHGIPVVCVPLGADQFYHASRVVELGVGTTVLADSRTPEHIRAAVTAALTGTTVHATKELADATRRLPDVTEAAELVERIAAIS